MEMDGTGITPRLTTKGTDHSRAGVDIMQASAPSMNLATVGEDEELLAQIRLVAASSCSRTCGTPAVSCDALPSIDGFRVTRLIAEGGMGRVYEAEQLHPSRRTAIKLLRAGREKVAHRLRLFRREADALARLQHPDIATVYCAGQTRSGEPFLAMEFVQGETLDSYAAAHELRPQEVLGLVSRICRAVHHAHERGVIHRDLKPSNIMVDPNGQPKILDFGLARIAAPATDTVASVTLDGRIAGTLSYMSPEQVCGHSGSVDARSDVYALGVILYQLLTGKLPIGLVDRGFAEIVDSIRTSAPLEPSHHRPGLDVDVDHIVLRALEKSPADRYQSALELAEDIDRRLAGVPIADARRTASVRRRMFAAAGAGIALLVSVAAFGVGAWRSDSSETLAGTGGTSGVLAVASNGDPEVAHTIHRFGPVITLVGELHEIESDLRTKLVLMQAAGAGQDVRGTMVRLALVLERQGRFDEAESLFRKCLDEERNAPQRRVVTVMRLARCVSAQGDHEQAERLFSDCMKNVRRLGPLQASVRTEIQVSMARDLVSQDRLAEARTVLDRAAATIDDSAQHSDWARWSVATAFVDYFKVTGDVVQEVCWRQRAEQAFNGTEVAMVCQQ